MARGVVRQTLRRGPAWSDEAEQSRLETSEVANELADLRARRERGDLSNEEFERRAEQLLDTDSVIEARQTVEQQGVSAAEDAADEGTAARDADGDAADED